MAWVEIKANDTVKVKKYAELMAKIENCGISSKTDAIKFLSKSPQGKLAKAYYYKKVSIGISP